MIGCRVDGEHPVCSGRQAVGQRGRNRVISIKRCVQTLEESKLGWVCGLGVVETVDGLDHEMRVTNEDTLVVDLGRCSIVVGVSIGERASLEVLDLELGSEWLVGRDLAKVLGENELC